jgi:hypothetical protein
MTPGKSMAGRIKKYWNNFAISIMKGHAFAQRGDRFDRPEKVMSRSFENAPPTQ